jgi:glycosyltransferase involved in cell wall biosynthesis
MRIAIIHSEYRGGSLSGENQMVKHTANALSTYGYHVQTIKISTTEVEQVKNYKVRTALNVSLGRGQDISSSLDEFKPDLILCHNTFPNIGFAWMKNRDEPIITFLHNYRYYCASATLNRQQKNCDLCPTKNPIFSLVHKCYKDSFMATLPLYLRQVTPKSYKKELSIPKKFIALSERSREKFIEYGIPNDKIFTISNFIPRYASKPVIDSKLSRKWIFAGRITNEKGIAKLLHELPDKIELDIYGDGPDRQILETQFANERIRFLGSIPSEELSELLPSYQGAFFPSLWSEGLPVIFLEYLRALLPVITTKENSVGDFVSLYRNGYVLEKFEKEAIAFAVKTVTNSREDLSRKSGECFEMEFSPDIWMHKFRLNCL